MVEVAFYIANKGRLADKIQSWLIGSEFSHAELIIDNVCYSSSLRDGGVRHKAINTGHKWRVIELGNIDNINLAYQFFESVKGCKYDLLSAMFNQSCGVKYNFFKNRYYCTELIIAMLRACHYTQLETTTHINDLYAYLKTRRQYD